MLRERVSTRLCEEIHGLMRKFGETRKDAK